MSPRVYEKILYVLDLIYDAKELARKEDQILVEYDARAEKIMTIYEFENAIKKLSVEILIIRYDEFLNLNRPAGKKVFIIDEVYDCFDEYYRDFRNKGLVSTRFLDKDDKEVQTLDQVKGKIQVSDIDSDEEVAFELGYDEWYFQITINGKLLKTPQYNSANRFHPNEDISIETLKEVVKANLDEELDTPLKKVAYELGFTSDRKKAFFKTTKDSAKMRIKVTNKDIKELNIDPSKILPEK